VGERAQKKKRESPLTDTQNREVIDPQRNNASKKIGEKNETFLRVKTEEMT